MDGVAEIVAMGFDEPRAREPTSVGAKLAWAQHVAALVSRDNGGAPIV